MDKALTSPPTSVGASPAPASRRAVALWLLLCAGLVIAMIVVGGMTRLTHSGLSIVEWQPLVGVLPPMDAAEWLEVFAKYQQTPEYNLVNKSMTLAEFKGIFWLEYAHRLLGRLIGAAFLLPLIWLWWRRLVDRALAWKLGGIFVLGGLQGALGWYMVASGLTDEPRVSHLRLSMHLGLGFAILGAILWVAFDLLFPRTRSRAAAPGVPVGLAGLVAALVFLQVLVGGLVAGLRAGHAYNTFPLMNDHFIPPETLMLEPWWLNVVNNPATVQLQHRLTAWALLLLVPWLWLRIKRSTARGGARAGVNALLGLTVLQFSLGVATLLAVVPIGMAAAHQGVAAILFATALFTLHAVRR